MSTHNIGFYADSTKIIFQLSSNFIKCAPYLFFCIFQHSDMNDEMRTEAMELCVTACEKFASNNEVRLNLHEPGH